MFKALHITSFCNSYGQPVNTNEHYSQVVDDRVTCPSLPSEFVAEMTFESLNSQLAQPLSHYTMHYTLSHYTMHYVTYQTCCTVANLVSPCYTAEVPLPYFQSMNIQDMNTAGQSFHLQNYCKSLKLHS